MSETTPETTPQTTPETTPQTTPETTPQTTSQIVAALSVADLLQSCVIGCGQCGSRIAAFFDKTPTFLKHRSWQLYPVKCAAVDTDPGIETELTRPPWNWQEREDIHGIPLASSESVFKRIFKTKAESKSYRNIQERMGMGQAGHFPYMGTIAAEERLRLEDQFGNDIRDRFVNRGFTRGLLLVANSLTGGTGTGFAPVIPKFFSTFWKDIRLAINLCIIPQMRDIDTREIFPGNIIYGLYQLSQNKKIDAVILADNDVLSSSYNCKGNPAYNSLLHEILAPFMLAPLGEYGCPDFGSTMDHADMRRVILPDRGFGVSELCALSYAYKKPPRPLCLKLKSRKSRATYVQNWLHNLVDSAICKTTVGITKADSQGKLVGIKGALGILSGPPYFFNKVLEGVEGYYSDMEDYIKFRVSPNFQLAFLQFPEMKQVRLSLILSGITSNKLESIYREVVPPEKQHKDGSLMERIRQLDPKTVEEIMIKEIREKLSKKMATDGK